MRQVPQRLAIGEARWPEDSALVDGLFRDYVAWAGDGPGGLDPGIVRSRLPGPYARPHGCVLIAHAGPDPVGVAAYRRRRTGVCEMTRLYVRPVFRGLRVSEALLVGLIDTAAEAGYRAMVIEVGAGLSLALELYEKAGFAPDRRRAARPGQVVLRRDLPRGPVPAAPVS